MRHIHGFSPLHADPRSLTSRQIANPRGHFRSPFRQSFLFRHDLDHCRFLASTKTSEYVFISPWTLSSPFLATLWVLFVFTFGGWIISLWENAPEELTQRGTKYTNRAVQALQDPTGRENAKNIYFGLIMGVSAALPTCLHLGLFLLSVFRKSKSALFPKKIHLPLYKIPRNPIDLLPSSCLRRYTIGL